MTLTRIVALILLITVAVVELSHRQVSAYVTTDSDANWNAFKIRYDKKYPDSAEETNRRNIWKENLKLIVAHNEEAESGQHTFTMGENEFTDRTNEEYRRMLGSKSEPKARGSLDVTPQPPEVLATYNNTVDVDLLPPYVNWTQAGWVGRILNQGHCGGCWAYSASESIQSQYYNLTGKMVQLSPQNLIDCSRREGNHGCDGGYVQRAFWYVQKNGIESLVDYPDVSELTGAGYRCKFNASLSVTSLQGWHNINSTSEAALQQAVALVGPVSALIDASPNSFHQYSSGIYSSKECNPNDLDHAILVVGYGGSGNESYWLIKNSWGTSWGIDGYMMLARGSNMCGVATHALFPVIDQLLTTPAPSIVDQSSSASTSMVWHPVWILTVLALSAILLE